jgi:uncharacterized protein (UPF0335 family)
MADDPVSQTDLRTAIEEIHRLASRKGWDVRDLTAIVAIGGAVWSFSAAWTIASNRIDALERSNASIMTKIDRITEVSAQLDTLKQSVARIEDASRETAKVAQETRDNLLKMGLTGTTGKDR